MQQEARQKALTVRVPNELWKAVKIRCVEEDTSMQSLLLDLLRTWAAGRRGTRGR